MTTHSVQVKNLNWRYARTAPQCLTNLNFDLSAHHSLAIVGPSGCGKTTLLKLILALLPPPVGSIMVHGRDVGGLRGAALRSYRKAVQYIPQNPGTALNPRYAIGAALREPFLVHRLCPTENVEARVVSLLDAVGLETDILNKRPHELSGGMQQRVVIARALSFEPELLVADEPTSSLDAVHAAEVIELLRSLRTNRQLIVVTHRLHQISTLVHKVLVMDKGMAVEHFDAGLLESAVDPDRFSHPIIQALFAGRVQG